MAKKKVKKKSKKPVKVTNEVSEEERVSRAVKVNENRTVAGFLIVIILLFGVFLVTYNFVQKSKTFEYLGVDWNIIEEPDITWYHGNFSVLYEGSSRRYNLYIRDDPRKNDVEAEGDFRYFKYGGIISFTPETATCRGEVAREVVVLGDFLKNAVGMRQVDAGTTDMQTFLKDPNKVYATCNVQLNRSVIVIEKGEVPSVKQDEDNLSCYTITIPDCEDGKTIEKFMLEVIEDMGNFENKE